MTTATLPPPVRARLEREQEEERAKAMRWGEASDMTLLFAEVDRLERVSDSALGLDHGRMIATILSRAVDELLGHAEAVRTEVIDEAVKACEFAGDATEADIGWHGQSPEEQADDYRDELHASMPTVEALAQAARSAPRP
jgi:hypothetical protein